MSTGARAARGAGIPAPAVLTFLIADVRGYTAFTGAHGDDGAARLAATFAEIVREGVEAHDGSVIELRGDEALAAFASSRQALRAAAALQRVFAEETALHPALPLGVGIGVDSGEAVPVEDGFRGGALNLAARLCARAGAGETLVSAGVVHLAGTVADLRIVPAGELDLKGMASPVAAYAVRDERAESTGRVDETAAVAGRASALLPPEL